MPERIARAAEYLKQFLPESPLLGIILGTGLNSIADLLEEKIIIPYGDIPGMPVSTAPSHAGKLVIGKYHGKQIVIFQGRLHYYEGFDMFQVTFPVRLLQFLNTSYLVVTNAAGSLREELQPGQIILLTDHINFMGTNPLIGPDIPVFGERFPSLNEPYDSNMIGLACQIARKAGIQVRTGTYVAVTGPSLETRAECRMFRQLGADLVGMSTVPEVIVAAQGGMKVLGISVITNMSNLFHGYAHSQEEIRTNAGKALANLGLLLAELIKVLERED
ncbi:MAG: purine-nucleoside phosphorylase [Candidatus Cloacimonetes bacterium]|nr:purine-nucleoside phosphorylase [Candidatus Cloacimonadota bacterium]